jgi:HNH endonuclease
MVPKRFPADVVECVSAMYSAGRTQKEIGAVLGVRPKTVWRIMRNHGIPARPAAKRAQRGALNASWKGGVTVSKRGYRYLLRPDHPRRSGTGYVAEHILVAEKVIGRQIGPTEEVHHINLDKSDNSESNLVVGTGGEHRRWHASLERTAAGLIARGLVKFDRDMGYVLADEVRCG